MMPTKKKTKKEEPQALAALESSTSSISSVFVCDANIIEETTEEVKAQAETIKKETKKTTSRKSFAKNRSGLTFEHKESAINIKIYEEQLPNGIDDLVERIEGANKDVEWIFAIIHDEDLEGDEIFEPSLKKKHIHIIFTIQEKGTDNKKKRRRIGTILDDLGVVFRPGLDDSIWANRGVERVDDLAASVSYLTHETKQAYKDGKVIYDRSRIISNLDTKEIDHIREGYISLTSMKKMTDVEMAQKAEEVYQLAAEKGVEWSHIYAELPANLMKRGNARAWLEERYADGIDVYMANHSEILRLCVFIKGDPNQGKTYAALHAFDGKDKKIITIGDGAKTGKTDKVRRYHNVMIIDDAIMHDVLGLADNKACQVYRRGSNNQYFCGQYLIVTSNLDFKDWLSRCNVDEYQKAAARSRFYVCEVLEQEDGRKFLHCPQDCISKRGTAQQQAERRDMFLDFRRDFERIINEYRPDLTEVDYSMI